MSFDLSEPHAAFALDAVRIASSLSRNIQENAASSALVKDDLSPVTVADFAVQAVIAKALGEAFPGAVLVGEESSAALREDSGAPILEAAREFVSEVHEGATADDVCAWIDSGSGDASGTYWTLDPIDGTKGFLRQEQYAIALAKIEDGRVVFGALGCPNLELAGERGVIMLASRGQGACRVLANNTTVSLSVSSVSEAADTRLLRSVEKGHTNVGQIDKIAEVLAIEAAPVPIDSQAKYALLAAGEGDALLRLLSPGKESYKECIWDQAAGSIVVEEAGGTVTDLEGRPLDFSRGATLEGNTGVCASNGAIHEALLSAVQATNPA